ncbi:unnamed protein product [Hydatigera taeniaeformis]|uniref:Fibronectin type-III domain-containing protein n=1 Tax=Hydatigena taeniaeformis TaxID=6205 RepID=A0A3P7HLF0_HYDTA|nr:unnamed protein product [Hydatigera taeniaeformis]
MAKADDFESYFSITPLNGGQIEVYWKPEHLTGHNVKEVKVVAVPQSRQGSIKIVFEEVSSGTIILQQLLPDTPYKVSVKGLRDDEEVFSFEQQVQTLPSIFMHDFGNNSAVAA